MPSQIKTNHLTIYMIKSQYQQIDAIVDSANAPIPIEGVGQFVYEESHPHTPDWVKTFFKDTLGDNPRIIASSAKGILIVPVSRGSSTTNFAISFGVGRHLLKEGVFEERFGLKVVLNSVGQESFRSIDKTALGSVPKHSREQMSRDVAPGDFGIDIEHKRGQNGWQGPEIHFYTYISTRFQKWRVLKRSGGQVPLFQENPPNCKAWQRFLTVLKV